MEISRLIFSKETKEKIEKGISPQRKGQLRWEKLKEAEENGVLQHAKTRVDVGKIVGLDEYKTAYSWVSGLIGKGALVETIEGFEDGRPVHTYRLGKQLSYVNGRKKADKKSNALINGKSAYDMVNENLSVREKGKILFSRLRAVEMSGKLAEAQTRADIATLVGYTEEQSKAGYSWVSNLINRGHIMENQIGVTPSGRMIYEYKLSGTEPKYRYEEARSRKEKRQERAEKIWTNKNVPVIDGKDVVVVDQSVIKIKITKGDISVDVETSDSDKAIKLITTILKGE